MVRVSCQDVSGRLTSIEFLRVILVMEIPYISGNLWDKSLPSINKMVVVL